MAVRIVDVAVDAVKQSIRRVTEQVSEIVPDMPTGDGPVSLDQVSVDLNVSANGSVGVEHPFGPRVTAASPARSYPVQDTQPRRRDAGGRRRES